MSNLVPQVNAALGDFARDHDVEAIANEIYERWGPADIDDIGDTDFWEIVKSHRIPG